PVPPVPTAASPDVRPNRTRMFAALGAVVVIVIAVVVVVVTRGGGSSSTKDSQTTEGQKYVKAMVATSDKSQFSGPETKCIADGLVDLVGVKTLRDAGVTPEKIIASGSKDLLPGFKPTAGQANSFIDMVFRCVDFGKVLADQMAGTAVSIPTDKLRCVGNALETNTVFRAYLVQSLLDTSTSTTDTSVGAGLQATMVAVFTKCGVSLSDLAG
ncbi:MAG: hypothetical protein WCI22_02525, partial [Actinomycetota bacterium]